MSPLLLIKAIGCTSDIAERWAPALTDAMQAHGIVTRNEIASFLAQVAHESALLRRLEENLNYSAEGLAATWPTRYRAPNGKPNAVALSLARRPSAIANHCYAKRMGNGDVASGDGWKYRGRGPIQITGRDNYKACGDALGVDLIAKPELLLEPIAGAFSAGWYWKSRGLDKHDDDESVSAETKLINGGTHGLPDRQALFDRALKALKAKK